MSFRYSVNGDEAMIKLVPSESLEELDVNAMLSKNDSEIYSVTIPINRCDLAGKDSGLLDNLDSWAVQGESGSNCVVSTTYIENVFHKLKPKPKNEEAKQSHPGAGIY